MRRRLFVSMLLLTLTACVGARRVARFILPPAPSDECVREFVRKELHKDWPRAKLVMVGDDLTILAEPEKGARSDYVIVDTPPRCGK